MNYSINIEFFKVNSLTNNANINMGPTVHDSHTANSVNVGLAINLGDNCKISSQQSISSTVKNQNTGG
jgi:hypothetical protein